MFANLFFCLAQGESDSVGSAIFNLRNGVLVLVLIVILVGYKMYKNKQM